MACPAEPHPGRWLLARRLLTAISAYDAILRGAALAPGAARSAALGLAHGWSVAVEQAPDAAPLGEGLELFLGALEDSLTLARAPTPPIAGWRWGWRSSSTAWRR